MPGARAHHRAASAFLRLVAALDLWSHQKSMNIENHELPDRWKEEVLRLARGQGFTNADFVWLSDSTLILSTFSRLVYRPHIHFFYEFQTQLKQARFCPGAANPIDWVEAADWKAHLVLVGEWLAALRSEVDLRKKIE